MRSPEISPKTALVVLCKNKSSVISQIKRNSRGFYIRLNYQTFIIDPQIRQKKPGRERLEMAPSGFLVVIQSLFEPGNHCFDNSVNILTVFFGKAVYFIGQQRCFHRVVRFNNILKNDVCGCA